MDAEIGGSKVQHTYTLTSCYSLLLAYVELLESGGIHTHMNVVTLVTPLNSHILVCSKFMCV